MKVFLLHRDRDVEIAPALQDEIYDAMASTSLYAIAFVKRNQERARQANPAPAAPQPSAEDLLTQDLELNSVWNAMAAEDEFLFETAKRVTLSSLQDSAQIVYRQQVLADCLDQPQTVRELYELALEALENDRRAGGVLWNSTHVSADGALHHGVGVLTLHLDVLRRLRRLAEQQADGFRSEGFTRFFGMIKDELADDYLQAVEDHLRTLAFPRGVLESAQLGTGDKGREYMVRRMREQRWTERLSPGSRTRSFSFTIPPRDEAGFAALADLRARGIRHVADAVSQSAQHISSFFAMLRLELAFYLGCVNLHARLAVENAQLCFPEPLPIGAQTLSARNLRDVSLSLHLPGPVVGSDVDARGRPLVVITGANQGGKSTLLRGLGLAQLMMQCGMFVAAGAMRASICTGVFTHYKREEDADMRRGKLDEELARMSQIADWIKPGAMLLCNESFASTNEREGSEIARQIVRAMLDKQVRVVFVTHMYDLAHGWYEHRRDSSLFLRAERGDDGTRTFNLVEAEPLPTSYGADSYRRVFGTVANASRSADER